MVSYEYSILGQTIHYTISGSAFIRVFGYEESTGIIFEVREIVVLRFRRQICDFGELPICVLSSLCLMHTQRQ